MDNETMAKNWNEEAETLNDGMMLKGEGPQRAVQHNVLV